MRRQSGPPRCEIGWRDFLTLRRFFLRLGFALRRVVFLRRVVLRLLGDFLRRVVFLRRVTLRRLGLAFLRVVFLRRVVFLLLGAAFRRTTLLVAFVLAIVFLPFLLDFTLFFRLAEVFLFTALRFAGRRGFNITTSARGILSNCRRKGEDIRDVYWYMCVSYIYRLLPEIPCSLKSVISERTLRLS